MRIVIAGAGSVGRFMARQLHTSGHDVIIVDQDRSVVERHQQTAEHGMRWHVGDSCELDTLAAVGCADADVVAAVTGDDEDNLVISLLAKQEFGVPRVLARVNNPDNEWMFNEMWGVDRSVSTPHLLTALVEEAVSIGSFVRLMSFADGRTRLAEVTLADDSPAVDREVGSIGLPREANVVAIVRDGHVVVPHPDTVLHSLDEVLVLVSGEADDDVRRLLIG